MRIFPYFFQNFCSWPLFRHPCQHNLIAIIDIQIFIYTFFCLRLDHFQKCCQSGSNLPLICSRIIRINGNIWQMFLFCYKFSDINRLCPCRMTSGQYHLNNSIYMIFINDLTNQIDPVIVRCHDRTSRWQIFSCNGFVDVFAVFLHRISQCPHTAAIFNRHNNSAIIFYRTDHFQAVAANRASCHQYSRAFFQMLSLSVFCHDLIDHFFHHSRSCCKIESIFTPLHHLLDIFPLYRSRIQFHQFAKVLQRHTDLII